MRQPPTLRDAAAVAALEDFQPDLMIVVAYGLILPKAVLDVPRFGCWNIHASLLPRWRGAAPIQRAILEGDRETGVCIMQMDEGLDTGAVLARAPTPIGERETAADLHDRLARLGADLLSTCLANRPGLRPQPQDEAGACYAPKLDKAEAELDWTLPAPLV